MKLSETQIKCLEWLADDSKEFGCPGGKRTLHALKDRWLARVNADTGRWEITDVGLMELGPIALNSDGKFERFAHD